MFCKQVLARVSKRFFDTRLESVDRKPTALGIAAIARLPLREEAQLLDPCIEIRCGLHHAHLASILRLVVLILHVSLLLRSIRDRNHLSTTCRKQCHVHLYLCNSNFYSPLYFSPTSHIGKSITAVVRRFPCSAMRATSHAHIRNIRIAPYYTPDSCIRGQVGLTTACKHACRVPGAQARSLARTAMTPGVHHAEERVRAILSLHLGGAAVAFLRAPVNMKTMRKSRPPPH